MTTFFSKSYQAPCKLIEEIDLWDEKFYRVWLPDKGIVVKIPASDLVPIQQSEQPERDIFQIPYVAAAAKISQTIRRSTDKQTENVLLAPMDANVIPLPHQLNALSRAVSSDRVRYLLADEVGLGKTIEAGLILRELKLRGLVRRTLIVTPKSLATQWVAEMQTHFNERFQLIMPDDIRTLQRLQVNLLKDSNTDLFPNNWSFFNQIIVSMDSVKPLSKRKGWSVEKVANYNKSRFEDLVSAGWDLIIVDEAHRLGGSTDLVARHKLGLGLAESAPYLLLLSATPHQGKTDAFNRIMSLLDEKAFPDTASVTKETVYPYLIRTEKRKAITADGKPIFLPRTTEMLAVAWKDKHRQQEYLYEAVTEYVREGYNKAIKDKKHHIGFLMILMQRLVVSSTRAIRVSMQRRLEVLELQNNGKYGSSTHIRRSEEIHDMDGQELLETLLNIQTAAMQNEITEVKAIISQARLCEQSNTDAKAEALLERIYHLQATEQNPELKILIFTEFIPTQSMLMEFLQDRGFSISLLNGSMSMDERNHAQDAFRKTSQVLISTDAGGEGLNLQFCHVVVNYDIPWNPMRLEQRIGRVDRIGQSMPVKAVNIILRGTVEHRVREVLEEKLAVIFKEFGIDKTGDVLDSAQAGKLFEDAFIESIKSPNSFTTAIDQTVTGFREEVVDVKTNSIVNAISEDPDRHLTDNLRKRPINYWVEKMVISHVNANGGKSINRGYFWDIQWESTSSVTNASFMQSTNLFDDDNEIEKITIEHPKVRLMLENIPQFMPGQPIPVVSLPTLPKTINGTWILYEVLIETHEIKPFELIRLAENQKNYAALFIDQAGRKFIPTARRIWDLLINEPLQVKRYLNDEEGSDVYDTAENTIQESGQQLFNQLKNEHEDMLNKETHRGENYYSSKRKAIKRVGLPEVRNYRNLKLDQEYGQWKQEIENARYPLPGLQILSILMIKSQHE